jgi:hypothetical protein
MKNTPKIGRLKSLLQEEHGGFAITFEVLCTITMMFMFFFLILFVMMVMNGQRYMNTVLTSSAAEAARWGGVDTRPYSVNVGGTKLIDNAQNQLNQVVPEFNAVISGTPAKISTDGELITLRVVYHLPPFWAGIGVVNGPDSSFDFYQSLERSGTGLSMEVSVRSIMKAGRLL